MNDSQDLFLLLGFMLSSARGLYDEPPGYGPIRLMDAARRLLTAMSKQSMLDPYLQRLQAALEEACAGTGSDDELRQHLDRLLAEYAVELGSRMADS